MIRDISIKVKIALIGGISTVIMAFAIIFYVSNSMQNEAISNAKQNVLNVAKQNAFEIKVVLENANKVVDTLKDILYSHLKGEEEISRTQIIEALKQIINNNRRFVGGGTFWEPNAFDGKDKEFIATTNHDKTGRFIPYVYKGINHIKVEPLKDDLDIASYYQLPKKTKKTIITEPYFYPINGKDILMVTISSPIIIEDKFYGITTVDIALEELQTITNNLDIYEKSGEGVIIAYEGMVLAWTNNQNSVGKSFKEIFPTKYKEGIKLVQNAKEFVTYRKNEKSFEVYAPMQIAEIETPWSFFIRVPDKKVLEHSNEVLENVILMGIILTSIVLALFWLALLKIINPLLELVRIKNAKLEKSLYELKQTQKHLVQTEKMAALGGLVAGVAHEINTPVGLGITGMSHFVEETKKIKSLYDDNNISQNEFESYLDNSVTLANVTLANLKKAAQLVNSFKQISVDQISEDIREFNLKKYTKEILMSIHNKTTKSNVKIQLNCSEDINVNSYPGAYSQIVTNLILNSLIHAYDKNDSGVIELDFKKINSKLKFVYKDDGKGINKKNLKKIFDPFFTTNRSHGGSGLGLNIIYNIITQKFNGTITCKSEKDKGVEFIIIVPFHITQQNLGT
jgi:signal transduction histidine kinase